MTRRVALLNARLLDPDSGLDRPGGLVAENGRIADLGPHVTLDSLAPEIERVDLGGQCLAPGFVDLRVGVGEPGHEHKETIYTASRAAAAGGVTALACRPDTDPPIDDVSAVEFIARRAREVKMVKIFAQAAVTKGLQGAELAEMGMLSDAGAVAFSDGRHAVASAKVMARALSYARTFGLLIMQHPAEPTLAQGGAMNSGELSTRLGLNGIPPVAEVIMIERDVRLVELTGGRYHVAPVTTRAGIEAIRRAKARGLPVTCDTCPHYFTLTEVDVGDYRTFAKVAPPLRDEMDRRAVVEALADGTIDAITSDHDPQDQDSKRLPFGQAAFGIIGLETLLPLALGLVHKGELTLMQALRKLTATPADILGLRALGRLRRGAPADLVVFDPDHAWRLDEGTFLSKSKNTPFDRLPVFGRATRTFVDGRTVFRLHAETERESRHA